MFVRDLDKGTRLKLRNGWEAELVSDKRTNTPVCRVFGDYTEIGSVYAHDVIAAQVGGQWVKVDHTPTQRELQQQVAAFFNE
jgi:hypothetical protein